MANLQVAHAVYVYHADSCECSKTMLSTMWSALQWRIQINKFNNKLNNELSCKTIVQLLANYSRNHLKCPYWFY